MEVKKNDREIKAALIKAVEDKLTDTVAMNSVGLKPLGKKEHWNGSIWETIAELINNYLEREAKKTINVKIFHNVMVTDEVIPINDFVVAAKLKDVSLTKLPAKDQPANEKFKRYQSKFISGESISQAWGYAEGRRTLPNKPGMPTWHKITLFLNAFAGNDFNSFYGWEDFYTQNEAEIQQLLNNTKSVIEQKNKQIINNEHSYVHFIDQISHELTYHPIWRWHLPQIKYLLSRIFESSVNGDITHPLCLSITGTNGVSKTKFTHTVIQKYLLALQRIEKEQIIKIHPGIFSLKNNIESIPKEELLERIKTKCKGGILIIEHLNTKYGNVKLFIDLIKTILSSEEYKKTCLIMMGSSFYIEEIIDTYELNLNFNKNFSICFLNPTMNTIVEIFEQYAIKNNNYVVTESAKNSLLFYFTRLKELKSKKKKLKKLNLLDSLRQEQQFMYASEIKKLYQDILPTINQVSWIDQKDVVFSNQFQKIIKEYDELMGKYGKVIW